MTGVQTCALPIYAVASGIKPFKFSCFLFLLLSCVVPFVGGIIYAGVWYAAKNGKK